MCPSIHFSFNSCLFLISINAVYKVYTCKKDIDKQLGSAIITLNY